MPRDDMYDHEPWARLARKAGFTPVDTESSARQAFGFSADLMLSVLNTLEEAQHNWNHDQVRSPHWLSDSVNTLKWALDAP